jgi:glyoxylase-like metal-dependent hydrolase (beta-lactamase superfamily II)
MFRGNRMTAVHTIACPIPFPLKTVNCYYISDSRPTLIDTAINNQNSIDCIEQSIRQAKGSIQDIQRIIITHAHTDHAGLAGRLAEISGAEVFIHHCDHPKFISGDPKQNTHYFKQFQKFLQYCGVPEPQGQTMADAFALRVKQWVSPLSWPKLLSGDETFVFDDFELRVIPTPGHTAGSISLFNEADGVLFSGDTLLEKITPNPVAEFSLPDEQNDYCSVSNFSVSLQSIIQLNITRVLPGHGPYFSHGQRRATVILKHFKRRKQLVLKLMGWGAALKNNGDSMTLLQLTRTMFPGLKDMELFLGLSEAYAYVQLLQSESLIETWQEKAVCRYQLKH